MSRAFTELIKIKNGKIYYTENKSGGLTFTKFSKKSSEGVLPSIIREIYYTKIINIPGSEDNSFKITNIRCKIKDGMTQTIYNMSDFTSNLKKFIKNVCFTERIKYINKFREDINSVIEHLHFNGIVHNNILSENIYVKYYYDTKDNILTSEPIFYLVGLDECLKISNKPLGFMDVQSDNNMIVDIFKEYVGNQHTHYNKEKIIKAEKSFFESLPKQTNVKIAETKFTTLKLDDDKMLWISLEWLIEIFETLHLRNIRAIIDTSDMIWRYIMIKEPQEGELRLLSATCMLITEKFNHIQQDILTYVELCHNHYTVEQFKEMEIDVLKTLDFIIRSPESDDLIEQLGEFGIENLKSFISKLKTANKNPWKIGYKDMIKYFAG